MSRRRYRWTLGVLATGALVATATPAMAVVRPTTTFYYGGSSKYNASCFGYTGTFGAYTRIAKVDWDANGSVDECFGVAPDRTIWHAWRNSGGWKVMPNNGRADDMMTADLDDNNHRQIAVQVCCDSYWGSSYVNGAWRPWVRIP